MARVRCNCGETLSVPPSMRAAPCPLCYSIVAFTPKIAQIQYQAPGVSQYYYYMPAQNHYGYHYQRPSPQLSHISSYRTTKRAVLIGVSYLGQANSLKGGVHDVKMMTYLLIHRLGFLQESVLILTEEDKDPYRIPTKRNIQAAMNWLINGCQEGDSLVFFYAGHGSQTSDNNNEDKRERSMCPVDYRTEGKILDDEINETLVRPLPYGVTLHAVVDTCHSGTLLVDTCHSGTLLGLSFTCKLNGEGYYEWKDQRTATVDKGTSGGIAICFSASDDHDDIQASSGGTATGAMTISFCQSVEGGMTYGALLQSLRVKIPQIEWCLNIGFIALPPKPQVPQVTSSGEFDIDRKPFML